MDNSGLAKSTVPERTGPLPGARPALALLLAINLFNYIDRQVLSATIPEIERQLLPAGGADNKTKLGLLSTAFMLSYMLFALPFGWLAERVPRWQLVGVAVMLWSLASGASGLAGTLGVAPWNQVGAGVIIGTFGFLLTTRCFVGIGEAAYGPVAPDMLSDFYPVEHRGSALAWFYAAIPVGSALGYVLGGQAAHHLGWPWAFYLVVPPGLLLGLACFAMRESPRGTAHRARPGDYLILARTPSYVLDCLGMAMMTFAMGGIAVWMPDYIVTRMLRELPADQLAAFGGRTDLLAHVNLVFGMIVVVSGLGATLLGGYAGDWLRGRFPGSYFLVSAAAMLIGFPLFLAALSTPFGTPFPTAWVLIFLACFCLFFNTGPSNTILANVTHPSMRATGFAVNIFLIHVLGDVISPTIIGRVADTFRVEGEADLRAGFLTVSAAILLSGILWLAGSFFLERDTALAPHRLEGRR